MGALQYLHSHELMASFHGKRPPTVSFTTEIQIPGSATGSAIEKKHGNADRMELYLEMLERLVEHMTADEMQQRIWLEQA